MEGRGSRILDSSIRGACKELNEQDPGWAAGQKGNEMQGDIQSTR